MQGGNGTGGSFMNKKDDFCKNRCPDLVRGSIFECRISMESSFQELFNDIWQSKIKPKTNSKDVDLNDKNDYRGNQRHDLVRGSILICRISLESSFKERSFEVWQSKIEPWTRSGRQFKWLKWLSRKSISWPCPWLDFWLSDLIGKPMRFDNQKLSHG